MVRTDDIFGRASLTSAINLMKPPQAVWSNLLFGNHEPVETETIELSYYEGEREAAPFVRKNGAALMIPGENETFATVQAPNIRLKMELEAAKLIETRHPGDRIFVSSRQEHLSSMERYVARRQSRLLARITNATELLCSQIVQGQISYSVADEAHFQITLPRAAANDITLGATEFWDYTTDVTLVHIDENFDTAKDVISEALGLPVTHAIMGSEAAMWFKRNADVQDKLNKNNVEAGVLRLDQQYTTANGGGAIYLGNLFGVECWQYARAISVNGVSTPLTRAKYCEFISAVPEAEDVMYYGVIPDMDALEANEYVGELFSKSWVEKDPSIRMLLAQSRPLPWCRKPNSKVSMKVVSG